MNRVEKECCGDCARCELLANGEVDMVPCALDQLLRRVIKLERVVSAKPGNLAGDAKVKSLKEKDDERVSEKV
ncbi:MAG: hypothetical protein J6Q73_07760 [Bacteroidaceae bacterium]|nr:hypothetical protein [Bacteroidaceae bacterium]